ncbi:nucleoporin subcomplex protein binding to Pom34-domain-containing protein [Lenzites betulinus]|nr:nucleoporin subcomplex protein binding to Pom34-domain-containing protein [Lenzites betulinus]
MAADISKRSNLVDVTYQSLHQNLSGHLEGTTLEQLADIIKPRVDQLRNIAEPFGRPSDASKKKVDSGSVTLADGVALRVEDADKEVVFTISKKLDIDQLQALVLLRSFLYNEGLPEGVNTDSASLADELVEAITPFYYSERLHILRTLIPLLRAEQNASDPVHEVAGEVLPLIIPDGGEFADTLLTEYLRKTHAAVPNTSQDDTRRAAVWAKQNAKEQLVMLEVLFWTMWGYATCTGSLVAKIYETAYETHLGSQQHNSTYLLDEESGQILQDSAALWILLTVEVLELERAAGPGGVEISAEPEDKDIYWAHPEFLKRIHHAVISQGNSNFACTYIAWTFVLSRISHTALQLKEIPTSYTNFFDSLIPKDDGGYSNEGIRAFELMAKIGLSPDAGLFRLLLTLLTTSPLFVTSVAWRTGSSITDPNAVAYRSVLKGLLVAIVELIPVELIPDFDGLLEVWVALFGRSEPQAVAGICRQFWEADWHEGIARRAIVDVARSRFPVQVKPVIRLLRGLTATGFLETDPLSTADHVEPTAQLVEERQLCTRAVFDFFDELPTFTQVIHTSTCSGAHALYEKLPDRYGSSSASPGPSFSNLRPLRLPGGSVLPAKSVGQLLSMDGGDLIVVAWQHKHSGWKVLLELLTDYVNRRRLQSGAAGSYADVSFSGRGTNQPLALKLEDIGVEMDRGGDEGIIIDVLDLIRSVVHENQDLAQQLLLSMESGDPVVSHTMSETQPPDLVQLTTAILEEALTRSVGQHHAAPRTNLITSAISVLTALLAVPNYSNRVWLYIRSTSSLFGSDRNTGVASAVLAAERLTGHYTMTLALLHLVDALFTEATSTVILATQQNPKLQQVKEEVLMRAARFVHSEIWVEHMGWKYAQLGDRFEIGRRVSTFYTEVFKHSSPALKDAPFAKLSQAIADALLFKATTSTVNPLVASLVTGASVMGMLYASRRYGDARRLVYLLESHLALTRVLLTYKQKSPGSSKICLLEQALCSRVGGGSSFEGGSSRADPVDALAAYVKERSMGDVVPVAAMQVLFALCSSLSTSEGSASTIIGHLSDPEATVSNMVRIVQHPYDDALLRNAVWNFITLAVDKEPALARLFVTGRFRMPSVKGKEKAEDSGGNSKTVSALSVACDMLESWNELWELNPKLLASLLRFLDVVWQHGHEHKTSLDPIRKDGKLFEYLAGIVAEELGPTPDCDTETFIVVDGVLHSDHHDAVSTYSYRSAVKSHAAHVLATDIRMHLQAQDGKPSGCSKEKPRSYTAIDSILRSEDQITELIPEASSSAYRPELHDEFTELLKQHYPTLSLDHLQAQEPIVEREYGDDFAFTVSLIRLRLNPYASDDEMQVEATVRQLHAINMNLSLAHVQTTLAESWQYLLLQVVPYLRGDVVVRSQLLSLADTLSSDIAAERRLGEMMSNIHSARLSLLLSLLEIAWFSTSDKKEEIERFLALVKNTRGIVISTAQSPYKSILGQMPVPFHRPLLQVLYFCARHSRSLARRPKALNAEQRLAIAALLDAALVFVIDGLRVTFDRACLQLDLDVDQDMELLVAVFEQCTRPDLNPSPTLWLTRCQETDVVRASLQLFTRMDVVGLADVALLRARKQPLYTPHVLTFHMALASIPPAAERLAGEGLLVAYIENAISAAIRDGNIDVTIPELPGEESPAHRAYCSMLSIIAGVSTALGRHGQFFESEVCGLLQFYSEQIHRALSWTIDDALSLPLLEEIEQVVGLFGAIAQGTAGSPNEAVKRVTRLFTSDALLLLQQLNYALTHPNHLASLFEPITAEERTRFEADRAASSVKSPSEAVDPMRRPFLARLVHRLYRLSGTLLSALIDISGAETVLLGEPEDWQVSQALIVPHSKVVLGEPASLGTLLELGNCSLDILRLLVDRPPAQALTPATTSEKALDVRDTVGAARRALEASLLYAVTQLATWLSKPEFDAPADDADGDADMLGGDAPSRDSAASLKERRAARKASMTLAERLRRGMTGEMAADLQALLARAKPVVAKSAGVLGEKDVDLTQVLAYFVQERISVPA